MNEVFTDPKVVKVFHGADSDIEWLQRDLSLYVVNMFDTYQAAKRLSFARLSLAYLLKHFCQIDADKSLQLADWRMRPLPDELLLYARQDTHYLLYIYDQLRNELLKKANGQTNLLLAVYQGSTEVCKKRYIKLVIRPDTHLEMYRKSKRIFDNRQLYAFKELFLWRDKIARQEDESTGYVLPNHMMLQIAETLPREMQGILACCNPIPPLVRQNLHVLHQFILKAREQPLVKVVLEEQITNRSSVFSKNQDLNSHLYNPHDFPSHFEFRDDLPTLLGSEESNAAVEPRSQTKTPVLSVFDTPENSEDEDQKNIKKLKQSKIAQFVSPFKRYLAILPFAEQQRLEEIARMSEEKRKRKLCPEKNVVFATTDLIIKDELKLTEDIEDDIDEFKSPLADYDKRRKALQKAVAAAIKDTPPSPDVVPPSKKRRLDDDREGSATSSSQVPEELSQNSPNGSSSVDASKNHQKNKKKWQNNKTGQASSRPVDFDYSQVDFKKFQGGSARPQQNAQFDSKFRGKGKNNKANKKFNKLFNFSNVGKKK